MKRKGYLNIINTLSLIVILIATLFFVGCTTNRKEEVNKSNTLQVSGEVVEAKLTDKEKKLLQGLDIDKYFIFDAIIKDKTVKKIDFWVDYYEKGTLTNKGSGLGTDIQLPQDENARMIFSTQKPIGSNLEEKWTFSIFSNGSAGKGSTNIKITEGIQVINSSNIKESKIVIGKEIILAVIVGTDGEFITSSSIDILNSNDESIKAQAIKELLGNDYVYILKCKFK